MTVLAPGVRAAVLPRMGRALAACVVGVLYALGWLAGVVVFGALWAADSFLTGWDDARKSTRR